MESYHKNYDKVYYSENKERKKVLAQQRIDEMILWYIDIKSKHKCPTCPEDHWSCLDFHHREGTIKIANVADMVHGHYSKKSIIEEMAKCDLMCSNCHRKLHAKNILKMVRHERFELSASRFQSERSNPG